MTDVTLTIRRLGALDGRSLLKTRQSPNFSVCLGMSPRFLPKANAADERLVVVAPLRTRRQFFHFSDIAAAEYDVIRFERSAQDFDHVGHVPAPFFQSGAP